MPVRTEPLIFSIVTIAKKWQEHLTRHSILLGICTFLLKHADTQNQMQSRYILKQWIAYLQFIPNCLEAKKFWSMFERNLTAESQVLLWIELCEEEGKI